MELIETIEVDIDKIVEWEETKNLFPLYSEQEFHKLEKYLARHNETLPVVCDEKLNLIDGYNRRKAYLKAGRKKILASLYSFKNREEKIIMALVLNHERRMLTKVQSARATEHLAKLYRANPDEVRKKLSEAGKRSGRGKKGKGSTDHQPFNSTPLEKACKALSISKHTVKMVKRIDATKDKELISAVENSDISIKKAYELSFLDKKERKKYLKKTVEEAHHNYQQALDGKIKYMHGNCLEKLKELPEKSIYTCVTSPPYWALRDYGVEASIWGGKKNCKHKWDENLNKNPNAGGGEGLNRERDGDYRQEGYKNAFCSKCSAWRGQLGLEPTPELYVEHLVQIFREVKRVLKDDGTLWLNLGDSYSGLRMSISNEEVLSI